MHAYYNTLFVTLDIGKNVNWLGGFAGYDLKPVFEPQQVRTDRQGFEQVTAVIDALLACGDYDRVVLGHEPTGIYHEAWAHALAERYEPQRQGRQAPPLDYCFVNPWSSSRRRDDLNRGRKRKTDKVDLRAIAACLRDGLGQPAFLVDEDNLRFQLWRRAYLHLQTEQKRLANALIAQLDRLWPGAVVNVKRFQQVHPDLPPPRPLVASRPLDRLRLRAIIQHCPNPYHFLALQPAGIQAFFRQHLGRCGPATAQLAFQLVDHAVLPPPEIASLLAAQLQTDFAHFLALEQQGHRLASQAEELVPASPAAVLTSVPGISPFLAARYLAHLGHPQRFRSAAEVWAFAGFDLVTEESGDFRRLNRITKKGDADFRDTLYQIGFHTAQTVPAIARAKQHALAHGKGKVGAIIHAAHKANRICYHLLYHQLPFDPSRLR